VRNPDVETRPTNGDLPEGVVLRYLTDHHDERGSVTELFRPDWLPAAARQWNFVRSRAAVLRGVHVHTVHYDYLVVLEGQTVVGLSDIRPASPTHGLATVFEMSGNALSALVIPPGVAHGFCHLTPTLHAYAMSEEWTPTDELGCQWNDPELGITWPLEAVTISARDAALPSLQALKERLGY